MISGTWFRRVDPAADARSCSSSCNKCLYCDFNSFSVGRITLPVADVVVIVISIDGAAALVVSTFELVDVICKIRLLL